MPITNSSRKDSGNELTEWGENEGACSRSNGKTERSNLRSTIGHVNGRCELIGGKIVEVTRLKSKRDGTLKETLSVLIQFERTLPKAVQMGYLNFMVREYIPKPLRCYACQRMGHTAQQCKGQLRCARCGGQHEYGKCEKDAKVKCCNCGGDHSAAFGGCEVQREAREVQRVKITNKVSYAEAIKKVRGTVTINKTPSGMEQSITIQNVRNTPKSNLQIQPHSATKSTEDDDVLGVKKVNFVVFICHTVNVALQLKKKSDRIKAIVEAAGQFLDIKYIKADQIHAMLAINGAGENENQDEG